MFLISHISIYQSSIVIPFNIDSLLWLLYYFESNAAMKHLKGNTSHVTLGRVYFDGLNSVVCS